MSPTLGYQVSAKIFPEAPAFRLRPFPDKITLALVEDIHDNFIDYFNL
jgi:hypothetical protein